MSKKRCFFLKGFQPEEVNKKYGLCIISNIEKEVTKIPDNKTDIFDVLEKNDEVPVSFLDEKNDRCLVTMLEWINKEKFPNKTDKHCFWCHYGFTTKPLGCPIKFINTRIEKSYISHITKDKYYMKENITKTKLLEVLDMKLDIDIKPIETEYYLTDGIFCSFNCLIAYIYDNSHDAFYSESKMLTYNMYKDIVGKEAKKIKAAPHWRLLKEYGGPFSITDFRKSFNVSEYEECSFHMKTLSKIFKEK